MSTEHIDAVPARWSRRHLGRLFGGGLALLGSTHALAAPKKLRKQDKKDKGKKDKKKRFRNVTRSFANTTTITIPEQGSATPYPSAIQVSGFKRGKLLDVNVTLTNVNHTWPIDIDVLLEGPGLRRTLLMSDAGGNQATPLNNVTLTFDDQAAEFLPQTAQIVAGTYKPTNYLISDPFPDLSPDTTTASLATFNGVNPNGIWRLFVVDDRSSDSGSIAGGWSLQIRARVQV